MFRVAIVGITGYTGLELLHLLRTRSNVEVVCVASRQHAGKPMAQLVPHLPEYHAVPVVEPGDAVLAYSPDVVFFATPHGVAMDMVAPIIAAGVKVIDLSADFRIPDAASFAERYHREHSSAELLTEAEYGMVDLVSHNRLSQAQLIAVPGCYPTAVALGMVPLLRVAPCEHLVANCLSGTSGAGRQPKTDMLLAEVSENCWPYGLDGHVHEAEISYVAERFAEGRLQKFTFVPHIVPMARGMLATLVFHGVEIDAETAHDALTDTYARSKAVQVCPLGETPRTLQVRGTGLARISVHKASAERALIVVVATDNLGKGAAGQAIECFDAMTQVGA